MRRTVKISIAAASTAVAGALLFGIPAVAATTAPSPSASSSAAAPGHQRGGGDHTAVTGDELAKVTAAMKAKDSSVTVTSVRKDPDGSYDVFGTKDGAKVMYDVSADLKTFTAKTGKGGGDGKGGGRGDADTAVTGDELAKVTAAMKAKDSSVTVTSVRKDPDGSYDVFGTKDGARVMYDVSADLKTFTARTGKGGQGGEGGGRGPKPTATASPTS
ncbi:hypothetical protein ACQEVZ_03445 [Dactylosporangium sp. CA-152071]|uniref:hypothetical protein n=1 Tax=Dactylosporangium sp. CA-152071 TaxID=3239933 RepID=UPI003D8C1DF3